MRVRGGKGERGFTHKPLNLFLRNSTLFHMQATPPPPPTNPPFHPPLYKQPSPPPPLYPHPSSVLETFALPYENISRCYITYITLLIIRWQRGNVAALVARRRAWEGEGGRGGSQLLRHPLTPVSPSTPHPHTSSLPLPSGIFSSFYHAAKLLPSSLPLFYICIIRLADTTLPEYRSPTISSSWHGQSCERPPFRRMPA